MTTLPSTAMYLRCPIQCCVSAYPGIIPCQPRCSLRTASRHTEMASHLVGGWMAPFGIRAEGPTPMGFDSGTAHDSIAIICTKTSRRLHVLRLALQRLAPPGKHHGSSPLSTPPPGPRVPPFVHPIPFTLSQAASYLHRHGVVHRDLGHGRHACSVLRR